MPDPLPLPAPAPDPARARALGRALLPEVLLSEDLALALGVSPSAARRAVLRGQCGPYVRLGRRLCVRRPAFLAALEARETTPLPPPGPVAVAPPQSEYVRLLMGRPRR
ncbi:MAG: hypothetical protein HYZ53_24720 [Planctomycetes bacterium]|nr:hypothetical protein [Planctomycetota bacterium]